MITIMTVINGILVTIIVCITIFLVVEKIITMVNIILMVNPITMDIMDTIENMDKIIDQEPQVRVAGLRALGSICCVLEGIRSSICLSKKRDNEA